MWIAQGWHTIFQMPQIAVIMGCLVPIVGVIAHFWYKGHKARSDNDLKRALVEQGMSVEEIEQILSAGKDQ